MTLNLKNDSLKEIDKDFFDTNCVEKSRSINLIKKIWKLFMRSNHNADDLNFSEIIFLNHVWIRKFSEW